jgi:carboxylate-amine ligase
MRDHGWIGAERPWSVGIEEEVLLLDPSDWSAANRIDEVLSACGPQAAAETHACVVELRTAPHPTAGGAARELGRLRGALDLTLRDELGLRGAVTGTHPLATADAVATSTGTRQREVEATMRALAHREPTLAQHVHVGVGDQAGAVRALDGLRSALPLLLALSANSPFWRGGDSGFASIRTPIFGMFPRTGIQRRFGHYAEYVRTVDQLLRTGVIPDRGFLWWDARLQPRLGTVEVRIMDAQSRVSDVGALAALVQCLVRRFAADPGHCAAAPEVLEENRFLAARDGMEASLVDTRTFHRRPARDLLAELVATCVPVATELGCGAELAAVAALAADPGYTRQRRIAAEHGLHALPEWLAEEFAGAHTLAVA